MWSTLPLQVPVKVDVNWGDNWLEGKQGLAKTGTDDSGRLDRHCLGL
jgi:hypothetical protein